MNVSGQNAAPQVNLSQTLGLTCECGHNLFESSFILRKVSGLMTGTGQPGIVPINLFTCKECGTILRDTVPPEVLSLLDN